MHSDISRHLNKNYSHSYLFLENWNLLLSTQRICECIHFTNLKQYRLSKSSPGSVSLFSET